MRSVKVGSSLSWLRVTTYVTLGSQDRTKKGGFVDYEIDNTIDWGNGTEEIIPGYNYTQVIFYSTALSYCACLVRRL